MSQLATNEGSRRLGRWLRRWAALVVTLAVLGGVAGFTYASTLADSYSSSARILLRPSVGNPFSPETGSSAQEVTIAVATEAALVNSASVLALANDRTGNSLVNGDVRATVPSNTATIVVTAQGPSADEAEENAQALAEAFLAYREEVGEESKAVRSGQLDAQVATVQQSLRNTRGNSAAASRRADVLTAQLVSLQTSLAEIQSAATDPGTLLTSATAANRSGLGTPILTGVGVLGGLFVGALIALALGRRDTRISGQTATTVAGVPVLAVLSAAHRGQDVEEAAEADKHAFQRLRTYILASSAPPSAVAVSGVGRQDRAGEVAVGLGRSMALAGYRVAAVLANPDEASWFGEQVDSVPGLAEALRDNENPLHLVVERDGVALLCPGHGLVDDQELLSGRRFKQVVETLKVSHDYVLIVTGSAGLPAELATARNADVLLLVARDGAASTPEVREVAQSADLVGMRVTGLALQSARPTISNEESSKDDLMPLEDERGASAPRNSSSNREGSNAQPARGGTDAGSDGQAYSSRS